MIKCDDDAVKYVISIKVEQEQLATGAHLKASFQVR
jgi:hypothetical protein